MNRLLIALMFCVPSFAWASATVDNIRTWPAPDHTRVVFDLSGPIDHTLFTLKDPGRVVVDLRGTRLAATVSKPASGDRLLRGIRSAQRNRHDLRIVLDLKGPARPKSFLLKPNRDYGYRLVIDLEAVAESKAAKPKVARVVAPAAGGVRDVIIAIDPGHGGEDPGAKGNKGTREKDVVLAISRRLAALIDRERGMRAVLVRRGDYYIGLRKRMEIARRHRADLFVSIHADAFRDPRVHGSSVYVLSRNGASSEAAKWIADRENSADLVGGVSLDDKDDLLRSVLIDLSQTATLSASADAAAQVLKQLKTLGKTHKRRVQRAGFMVLKSPDIPSLLVETAFISNPDEERRLRNTNHQRRLAEAILAGIRSYFDRSAPPGTLLAARKHVITTGDTLSEIAMRYRVPLNELRQVNGLASDHINVGAVLRIPHTAEREG